MARELNEFLRVESTAAGAVTVCHCGQVLGPADANYKQFCLTRELPVTAAGPRVNPFNVGEGQFVLRQVICPGCAILLDNEVCLRSEPSNWDLRLKQEG